MSDKLEALSQPVAIHPEVKEFILDGIGDATTHDCITDCDYKFAANLEKLLQPLYSQEYVSALQADIEYMRWRIKEMDLLFGGMLLTMQAAVIEVEHGKGPNIAMEWIINKLMGPGEFAPDSEKDAQAYFNRESEKIDAEYSKVMEFYKQRREAQKEQSNG